MILNTNTTTNRSVIDVDAMTGEKLESRVNEGVNAIQNTFKIGKYKVQLCAVWTESTPIYSLNVISPDGTTKKIEFKA